MTKLKKNGNLILGTLAMCCAVLAAVTLVIGGETKSLTDVYNGALKQYNAGQYEDALKGFELVLKKRPGYVYARNYAVKCRNAIAEGKKPVVDLQKQLAAIRIPEVEFNKTDLGTVLEYLSQKTEELSGGKVAANFIYQGSDEDRKTKLVTLKVRNVPVTEVVSYVGRLTGTKFKYEQYAIVGTPIGRGGVSSTALKQPTPPATGLKKFDTPAPPDPFKKR